MTRGALVRAAAAAAVVLLGLAFTCRERSRERSPAAAAAPAPSEGEKAGAAAAEAAPPPEFLYGRVTTVGGDLYEGRLRWGGDQEALWSDLFYGVKQKNPWLDYVAPERRPVESRPISIFGFVVARRERPQELSRPFLAPFGDIARIDAVGTEVRVTQKSGRVVVLARFEASDFDDGVRVWDNARGVVDLDARRIRTIELLPTPWQGTAPVRLYGTVSTPQGDFTGFLQWNREAALASDELRGRTAEGAWSVRFDQLRAIARRSPKSSLLTLADGREVVLSGSAASGDGHRGVYVDDRRYGRVLVPWEAFERVDFAAGADGGGGEGGGALYGDFPPGRRLTGTVTTRDGRHLAGRLVFDLDESETTDTLDAPARGIDYLLPFGRVVAIVPGAGGGGDAARTRVGLDDGEVLELENAGDLGPGNAGMLVFGEGTGLPVYVPWTEVERVDFGPTATPPAVAL